jgi:hypothetical protein
MPALGRSPIHEVLHGTYADITKRSDPYPRDYFRASEVGKCGRAIVASMLGYPARRLPVKVKLVLSSGDLYHTWVRGLLRQHGVALEQEEQDYLHKPDGYPFSLKARIDGVVPIQVAGQKVKALLEVKSFSVFFKSKFDKAFKECANVDTQGYGWPKGQGWPSEMIWPDYHAQIQASMEVTRLAYAYFLPVFRDSGFLGFKGSGLVIQHEPDTVQKIFARLQVIYDYYLRKELPEGDYEPGSKTCSMCAYWDSCWGTLLGLKQPSESDILNFAEVEDASKVG